MQNEEVSAKELVIKYINTLSENEYPNLKKAIETDTGKKRIAEIVVKKMLSEKCLSVQDCVSQIEISFNLM